MMRFMAIALKALALLFKLFPLEERVAFLSRQSSRPSLDYQFLIEEIERSHPSTRIAVCLSEPETKSATSFIGGTFKHLYFACTSSVVIVDRYIPAVSIPKKRKGVTVIQMWHALGAIKKFGYQCLDTPAGRTTEQARIARMHKNYDWIIAGGPGAVEDLAEAFGYSKERILPLGLPRTDYLKTESPLRATRREKTLKRLPFLMSEEHVILYAPTLRKGREYEEDWLTDYASKYAEQIKNDGAILLVAGHPLNDEINENLVSRYPFIRFSKGIPTIDLIPFASKVVTDYSAVAFEAHIASKPIEFFTPDLDLYRSSPGLNLLPDEITPAALEAYLKNEQGCTKSIVDLVCRCIDNES